MQRRLAAILVADVVGYSRLTEEDEAGTLRDLKALRDNLIDPAIRENGGRIVNVMGDGLLAEFSSVVNAVNCALHMQRPSAQQDTAAGDTRPLKLRIGVHLGDIVVDDEDVLGDGVNVAARLEALAEPGGICISQQAFDQIENKLDVRAEDLGEIPLKNISRPIRVFKVAASSDPVRPAARTFATGRKAKIAMLVLSVTLALGAAMVWLAPWNRLTVPASEVRMVFPLPTKPSIAILPFDNLTGLAERDIVIDGLVEEIIASLAKIPQIFVIDGNSSFTYKGQTAAANEVAEDLGVRYVMEGSVRSSGDRLRITSNLIDAVEGYQIWADSYDRQLDDVFALQTDIAEKIVTELNVELVSGELARLQQSTTDNIDAYALFLRAQAAPRSSREDVLARIKLYDQSLALDPGFSAALAAKSVDYARMGRIGMEDRDVVYPLAEDLARQAIGADEGYSGAYLALSTVYRFRGEFDRSLDLVEQALALSPNSADAILYKGRMLRLLPGRAEEAIATIKSAMRINPYYPPDYLAQLSWVRISRNMGGDFARSRARVSRHLGQPFHGCGQAGRQLSLSQA